MSFEEVLLRNPYSLRDWIAYADHKKNAPDAVRFRLYERALLQLPGRCVAYLLVYCILCSYLLVRDLFL